MGNAEATPAKSEPNRPKNAGYSPMIQEETEHLDFILAKLQSAVSTEAGTLKRHQDNYMDAKRYLVNYRHEMDPKEVFQNEQSLQRTERSEMMAQRSLENLYKLLDSPYFARIDFKQFGECGAQPLYIGRFTYLDGMDMLIFDWRAPIASMFYDYELGSAGYDAPDGFIEGELTRKRQFKIALGKLEYALQSAVNIQDDVLQRELSHTSDEKMKTIIATIQKEQNQIIRNEQRSDMIIQGVAGSGKTSIALHRIAYLLYRYKETLTSQNVMILSPNAVFSDYISGVLPELGEEPLYEMSFEDVALVQLDGVIAFEGGKDPLELHDTALSERIRFKSTMAFLNQMNEYLNDMPQSIFKPSDYTFGSYTIPKEWIQSRYNAYKSYPVQKKLLEVTDDILERLKSDVCGARRYPKNQVIFRKLAAMLRFKNTFALYEDFYKQIGALDKLALAGQNTLEWGDVYPFMYFHAAFEGLAHSRIIRHLVIDEMQDYTPVQYAVIGLLFDCNKTILGDFGQSVNPYLSHNLSDLTKLFAHAKLVKLHKSYRSTYEIINFAKGIQKDLAIEPVERHGEMPCCIFCEDEQTMLGQVTEQMYTFLKSGNKSMGIILKSNQMAKAFYDSLTVAHPMQLLTSESSVFQSGITVTSIQMAKGLEFDAVIIPYADSAHYLSDYDRSLLYIACTRAMHQLTLYYTGEITPLITNESTEKRY